MKGNPGQLITGLTLEDDFVLTRVRNNAMSLKGKDRDQYFWKIIYKFVCRERAFKTVLEELEVAIDTNVDIFEDEAHV